MIHGVKGDEVNRQMKAIFGFVIAFLPCSMQAASYVWTGYGPPTFPGSFHSYWNDPLNWDSGLVPPSDGSTEVKISGEGIIHYPALVSDTFLHKLIVPYQTGIVLAQDQHALLVGSGGILSPEHPDFSGSDLSFEGEVRFVEDSLIEIGGMSRTLSMDELTVLAGTALQIKAPPGTAILARTLNLGGSLIQEHGDAVFGEEETAFSPITGTIELQAGSLKILSSEPVTIGMGGDLTTASGNLQIEAPVVVDGGSVAAGELPWGGAGFYAPALTVKNGGTVTLSSYTAAHSLLVTGNGSRYSAGLEDETPESLFSVDNTTVNVEDGASMAVDKLYQNNASVVHVTGADSEFTSVGSSEIVGGKLGFSNGAHGNFSKSLTLKPWGANVADVEVSDGATLSVKDLTLSLFSIFWDPGVYRSRLKVHGAESRLEVSGKLLLERSAKVEIDGATAAIHELEFSNATPSLAMSISDGATVEVEILRQRTGNIEIDGNSVLTIQSGVISGTFAGDGKVLLEGEMAVGYEIASDISMLTVSGMLEFGEGSELTMNLGKSNSSDRIRFFPGATAWLDGDLVLQLSPDYEPEAGDSFQLFVWDGNREGEFASISLDSGQELGPGLWLDSSRIYIDGTVAVVPEASTVVLCGISSLALGLLSAFRYRRLVFR